MKIQPVPSRRQHGGTFLGFVIGALFGLALALGVAVYVTKVPIPFLNKVQSRPAEPESEKNKDWNPNATLPGRLPPKPEADPAAQPASEVAAPSTPAATTPAPPAAAPAPSAPAAAAPAPAATPAPAPRSGDALGDLAKSRSEAAGRPAVSDPPPAAPQAADPFQYFVQTGAFRQTDEAELQRARLLLMGFQARISESGQPGRMVYRVRVGPFERREEADKTLERLGTSNITAVVVRVQR